MIRDVEYGEVEEKASDGTTKPTLSVDGTILIKSNHGKTLVVDRSEAQVEMTALVVEPGMILTR